MTTAEEFYQQTLGHWYEMDGVPKKDPIQCADYFKYACKLMLGYCWATGGDGFVDNWWYNRAGHASEFDFITDPAQLQNGDFVMWRHSSRGDTPFEFSHVAMYHNGRMVGQNQPYKYVTEKTVDASVWQRMLGAFRFKSWEAKPMTTELKDGLQTVTYNGINFMVVQAPEGFGMHVISASQSGVEPYRAVSDLKSIGSDNLLIKARVNGGYFDMSNNAAIKGQHYGVEFSETLALLPHQSGYQVFYELKDGTVGHCTADKFYYNKADCNFAITPYSIRIANGKQINDMTAAYGDKDNILNSQTVVFKLKSGRWCLAVTATGQKCYPRDIVAMAAACGAVELAVMDSGGSTMMIYDGQYVVYSSRWIANAMALAKANTTDPLTPATPTTDDKDKQIATLTQQVADQKAQITTLLTQVNTLTEKAKKAISDLS